ncbi:LytR cell envelope-related transcriptional attenuator [Actinopolyspora alba]|uniref:LytR cell envelope-related transcriptional attenuator n=1 Tax=Actinopolyspora alba TaxID=673379 RepID=A0A1I1Y5Q8_9ACTN|nr:LytR C-terminal domain-containing protein [Actinopolyspora alba]SFE14931.1 LytR cell envelope-related transcriptional attenuator [Actinopolyspora alba]
MPSGEFATGRSAARIGGFTLLGVGVLALFFGVATALTGDREPSADPTGTAPPPPASTSGGVTSTSAKTPGTSAPNTSASSEPSESSNSRSSETSTDRGSSSATAPGTTSESRNGGGGSQNDGNSGEGDSRKRISLRVYNNSKIDNLAHRAARDLRGAGFRVVEVGNYAGGRIPVTTVYYRPDTGERAQARTVARRLDARVEPRFNGITDASPGVIVIVTKNYDGLG